jgi:hypothetical protein
MHRPGLPHWCMLSVGGSRKWAPQKCHLLVDTEQLCNKHKIPPAQDSAAAQDSMRRFSTWAEATGVTAVHVVTGLRVRCSRCQISAMHMLVQCYTCAKYAHCLKLLWNYAGCQNVEACPAQHIAAAAAVSPSSSEHPSSTHLPP